VIQLFAIVAGRSFPMLTGETVKEAAKSCKDRFGTRFEGFDMPDWQRAAHEKWGEFQAKEIGRQELNDWLAGQGEQTAIRGIFNQLRG
jgi:hypothetical protein